MPLGGITRLTIATMLASLGLFGAIAGANPSASPVAQADPLLPIRVAGPPPNIVLILTDDQRFDELGHMPTVRRTLIDRGMWLRRSFVVNSLCCPSRASTLTGSYSHTHGIYLNGDGMRGGGFPDFRDGSTLPVWLRGEGYETAMIGKYLNNYEPGSYVPPGWTFWGGLVGANAAYYDYDLSIDGRVEHHASKPRDYATDVFARLADGFIRGADAERPVFLYFSPPAAHGPYTSPDRYEGERTSARPTYPSFNETDRSDKPWWIARRDRLSATQVAATRLNWAERARSLMAVDDAVKRIVNALAETGRLDNTLFVYTSDNGVSMGEHGLRYKMNAFEESIRVPMIVRWDGHVPPGTISWDLAANIDLAPTFTEAAGATTPSWVEGVSLLPLLRDGEAVRNSFLIEHQHSHRNEDPPTYCAVRTDRWKLVRYASGSVELYNLKEDPWELHNLATKPAFANLRASLTDRLRRLCSPRPPGMGQF